MRTLSTIDTIHNIRPIPKYDALGGRGTFKAINPQYLIKHKI